MSLRPVGSGDVGVLGGSDVVDTRLVGDSCLDPYLEPCLPRNRIGSDIAPIKSSGEPIFTCRVNPLPNLNNSHSDVSIMKKKILT